MYHISRCPKCKRSAVVGDRVTSSIGTFGIITTFSPETGDIRILWDGMIVAQRASFLYFALTFDCSCEFPEKFTRELLIHICELAIVPLEHWMNRDTPAAQIKVGTCWALLKAGCLFKVRTAPEFEDLLTNDQTIYLDITYPCFEDFEYSQVPFTTNCETYYLPTLKYLAGNSGDWY